MNKKFIAIFSLLICTSICFLLIWLAINRYNEQIKRRNYIDLNINRIKNKDGIAGIEAEMKGENYAFKYPTTRKFAVPPAYYNDICELFSGRIYPYAVGNIQSARKSQYGSIYIEFSNLDHVKIDFFMSGKGVLEYSVDGDFFVADTGDTDGGTALLMLLNEAYKSAETE